MNRRSSSESSGSIDWILLAAVAALIAIGLMMVYSSTFDMGYRLYGDSAFFLKRQLTWLAIGAMAMVVATRLRYQHWMKLSLVIMGGALLLLAALVILGRGRHLLGNSISPAELAKLAIVIYISHWLVSKGELLRRLPYGLLPFTIIVGLVAGLVMAQPDLSEALVIVLMSVAMFFLAGADLLQFVIGILGGGAAFAFVITRLPVAMERLQPYLLDWQDPLGSANDQLIQGLIALGSGGLFGLGPGNGRMKYQWLPAAHTDSIFAVLGEEMGLVGCLALIALFGLVAYRGFRIAEKAPDGFGRLLACGITCWIVFQAMINIAVVTGTMPFTGIVLPFISVGGSSLVTCMVGVGIMLSISRSSDHPALQGAT
ncbi:MAG: cell division protein FtsW [Anaerolineae bacterium]|nr:cell division protein FtsW [Anaerolineae bacterium]